MKKNSLLLLLILHIYAGLAAQNQEEFRLDGVVHPNGYPISKVILDYYDNLGKRIRDTADVIHGQFRFKGTLDPTKRVSFYFVQDFSRLVTKKKTPVEVGFAMENKAMKMAVIDPAHYIVSGSALHTEDRAFRQQLQQVTKGLSPSATRSAIERISAAYINTHPHSILSIILMDELVSKALVIGQLDSLWKKVDHPMRSGRTGIRISERIDQLAGIYPGSKAPGFVLPDQDGILHKIEAIPGKYLLLHFWASWCKACRTENEWLTGARQALDSSKIVFVSVSIDELRHRNGWIESKQADKLNWLQLVDEKGIEGAAAKAYGVMAIPRNFLIDSNGIIVAMDLRAERLIPSLQKFLK